MATPIVPNRRLTLTEFLEFEGASPVRHELVAGEGYAMEGASKRHNWVGGKASRHCERTSLSNRRGGVTQITCV